MELWNSADRGEKFHDNQAASPPQAPKSRRGAETQKPEQRIEIRSSSVPGPRDPSHAQQWLQEGHPPQGALTLSSGLSTDVTMTPRGGLQGRATGGRDQGQTHCHSQWQWAPGRRCGHPQCVPATHEGLTARLVRTEGAGILLYCYWGHGALAQKSLLGLRVHSPHSPAETTCGCRQHCV